MNTPEQSRKMIHFNSRVDYDYFVMNIKHYGALSVWQRDIFDMMWQIIPRLDEHSRTIPKNDQISTPEWIMTF